VAFKDHFSGHASAYAQARPSYPSALFDWAASQCPSRTLAWDAGCGNGQASVAWGERFDHVHATDPSAPQIANATPHPHTEYAVEPAEHCSLGDASADLATVAQALHWFDFDAYFAEVRRVLRPGGLFVALSYAVMRVTPQVDAVVGAFERDIVGTYWPPERAHVDDGYASIPFPLTRIDTPPFEMTLDWTSEQALAYLATWSCVQRHDSATGGDAVADLRADLTDAWGEERRIVTWPLTVLAGRA
jgi:ubiquinone/menaquinone biosynthesis C-methylase UbiE